MTSECQNCSECKTHTYDYEGLKGDFKEHKKAIWLEMNKKLSAGMFKWISGFLIVFCIGCGGLQMAMLTQIASLKTDIAVLTILIEKTGGGSAVLLKEKDGGE